MDKNFQEILLGKIEDFLQLLVSAAQNEVIK